MSSIIEKGYGVGDVISLLWFKRSLPRYCTQFIEVGYSTAEISLNTFLSQCLSGVCENILHSTDKLLCCQFSF